MHYLAQRSEQIKIQYFCPIRPVKIFDKRILRRPILLKPPVHSMEKTWSEKNVAVLGAAIQGGINK
ncbi:TPA: hypothetical protein O4E34_000696 [Proteus mirabilis]|uniref:hypothetical protein n=1 Tax=Proteus mirabilis TaxID=584 RepID=UPI0015839BB1|nr:hypothetical protein [Proteus mirabilis]HCZ8574108.1 hypothetical protein [Proteus mirabilis]